MKKILLTIGILSLIPLYLLQGCAPAQYNSTPATPNRYKSKELVKEWRNRFKDEQYPRDNDGEYYYPKYPIGGYLPAIPAPKQHYAPYQNPYVIQPPTQAYPQDNDANYANPYPKYDPDADNNGYYYQPGKKLPPKRDNDYMYPIYFDD